MADKPQVIKLAQAGIDVKTAGDENLVYNSNWPLLKIAAQGEFQSSQLQTPNQLVTNHNLGYVPAYWFFSNDSLITYNGSTPSVDDNRSEYFGPTYIVPSITKDRLIYEGEPTSHGVGTDKLYYYIFALDISKAYTAPQIKSGGVIGPRNTNTVFKLAKSGKDTASSSLEDYIVHSRARSPMIHAVVPGTLSPDSSPAGFGFTYYHNLGYIPLFFAYVKTGIGAPFSIINPQPDSWQLLFVADPGVSGFTVDEQKISYSNLYNGLKISLVILKDPFNLDSSASVTI